MNYEFPRIETINDVLPFIEGKEEFIVAKRPHFTVIDYRISTPTTFDSPMSRECRGLIFDLTGKIIARRYHKFFNLNEKEETQSSVVDFNKQHQVLSKLDGSMISPVLIDGEFIRLTTRMGITDVAQQAEVFTASRNNYNEFMRLLTSRNFTPIFEWCSKKNRIVIEHSEDNLYLTAVRNNFDGNYLPYTDLMFYSDLWDIPVVPIANIDINNVRDLKDTEGIVVRFADGHMIKVKSDWYVNLHKTKEDMLFEKNIIRLILENKTDDIRPVLMESDLNKLNAYENSFWAHIIHVHSLVLDEYIGLNGKSKKDYALSTEPSFIRSLVLSHWDSRARVPEAIRTYVLKNLSSSTKVDEIKKQMMFPNTMVW